MNKLTTRALRTLLASTAMLWFTSSQAANSTYTWVGTTNDLTLSSNWNPQATPISGDIGLFGLATYTPEVAAGSHFTIDLIKFTGGAPYAFNIKDLGSSLTFTSSGAGPAYGVQNNSVNTQNFNVFNQGQMNFQGSSSADSYLGSNVNNVNYNVGNVLTPGTLIFKESSQAGQAEISINNGLVQFKDDSTAEDSTISLISGNSILQFDDASGASFAVITAKNGNVINFNGTSNADDATINLGDSVSTTNAIMNFKNGSDAGQAIVNMSAGSVVNFLDGSTPGTALFTLTDEDVINLAQSQDTEFHAEILGNGTINKISASKVNLLADNSEFAGTTNIFAGNFAVNSFLGGNVFVKTGGMVSGTGKILGNLHAANGALVAPGNSIGVLNVGGNYTQAANSTFFVEVDSAKNASKLIVDGQVSLNQGSNLLVQSDFVQMPRNSVATAKILESPTGISGTFSNVSSLNPLLFVNTLYEPNAINIVWGNKFSKIGKTSNQIKVTDELQTIQHPSLNNLAILSALATDTPKHQQRALNQLIAQPYANLLVTAEVTNHKFIKRLYNPLRLLMTSHPCCSADSCCSTGCMVDTWIDSGWDRSNFRGNRNARGFSLKGFEVTLGSQVTVDNCWTMGAAACYERDHIHYKVGGKGISNTYLGGLYTLYRPSDFYVLSDLVLGYTQSKLKRHVDFGSYHFSNHGKPDIYQGTLYVEAGQDFGVDCFLFQPFVGIEAGYFRHDHIYERNSNLFSVSVKNKTHGAASSRLGVHFLTEFSCFKLFFDSAWQYRMSSLHNRSIQHFQHFGKDFKIVGIPFARSSFDTALNLSATLVDGLEVYVEGEGQWWKDASTFSVLGGFIIAW